jgi:hypothetical protein
MESDAASDVKKPAPDDLLVIGANITELRWIHPPLEFIVRILGSCFSFFGVITILLGLVWIAEVFGIVNDVGVVKGIEDSVREAFPSQADNQFFQLLRVVAPPVLFMVVFAWLLFRIGRGLRQLSPRARWAALAFLVPACVPPLVVFFVAVRVRAVFTGAGAVLMLIIPAAGSLALSVSSSDLIFSPGYRALVGPEPGPLAQFVSKIIVFLLCMGLLVTIALISSGS